MRDVRPLLLAAVLSAALAVTSDARAQDPYFESLVTLYEDEDRGLRYYERGDYDKAFEFLSRTATRGLKKSQYILAFMFLKGQHVDKSILLGMGWLGVAAESGDEEWQVLYDGLYERATPGQRAMIDAKVAQYVERYGMEVMNVTCSRQPVTGSRRIETRCLKAEGPAYTVYPVEMHP